MKTLLVLAFVVLALPLPAQMLEGSARSLFSDVKAFRKGETITILIVEDTQADNTATTTDSRTNDLSLSAGGSVGSTQGEVGANIGTNNRFQGRGTTSRNERVRARMTARVLEVENNYMLRIEGKRNVTINGEQQTISISGYVRPVDIQPDNTVFSYNISDLTLTYTGNGTLTTAQEPGFITKFLRMLF